MENAPLTREEPNIFSLDASSIFVKFSNSEIRGFSSIRLNLSLDRFIPVTVLTENKLPSINLTLLNDSTFFYQQYIDEKFAKKVTNKLTIHNEMCHYKIVRKPPKTI